MLGWGDTDEEDKITVCDPLAICWMESPWNPLLLSLTHTRSSFLLPTSVTTHRRHPLPRSWAPSKLLPIAPRLLPLSSLATDTRWFEATHWRSRRSSHGVPTTGLEAARRQTGPLSLVLGPPESHHRLLGVKHRCQ